MYLTIVSVSLPMFSFNGKNEGFDTYNFSNYLVTPPRKSSKLCLLIDPAACLCRFGSLNMLMFWKNSGKGQFRYLHFSL